MEKFVTAVFDSVDSADFAHARLSRSGVRMSRYETFETHPDTRDDLELIINPEFATFSNNIDESWGSLAGANMMDYGGFLFVHKHGENGAASSGVMPHDKGEKAAGRKEVLMRVLVDERDLPLCEAVLTSEHASRVRIG